MAPQRNADRPYDVVLLGATGFTGGLTADYLARHAPSDCRWAIAGRNLTRLAAVRDRLCEYDASLADLPMLSVDLDDAHSVLTLAHQARVVASTVGPFLWYGEPLVAACAAAGTDYVDLTGESEFVDRMFVAHHATALASGARLVHACGFDSIPYDLGVQFTVEELPPELPITIDGYVSVRSKASAGTYHSAINAFSRVREAKRAAAERRQLETRPVVRKARAIPGKPHRAEVVNAWALPLPTIDPRVVARSARALERYGPDFTYRHFAAVGRLPAAVTAAGGVTAAFALAQAPLTRRWLLSRMQPGDGPSERRRARSWFRATFVGRAGDHSVLTRVSGGDPGYDETAKMLAESALCLAFDELPETSGQVTTAVAMGAALRDRLVAAGLRFEVLSGTSQAAGWFRAR